MIIKAGDYSDCKNAQIVVITAGIAQKPGQTRLELAEVNAKIMKQITQSIMVSGFNGTIIVASNPVDLMSYVVYKVSGLPKNRVIGSGTVLDTARLRYLTADYLKISSKNIHAYIMGEHGDSSFVPWEHVYVGCKKIKDIMKDNNYPMEERGLNASVIEILSVIHDNWVKSNGNKFEDPKRMGKLYQFVDLKLLDFGEAKLDLLFLQPILEANGITLDEVALQQEFLQEQKEFLDTHGIKDQADLKEKLGQGAEFYPPLEGVTTSKGKTAEPVLITDRLQDSLIVEKMTEQVAQRAQVPEKAKASVDLDQVQEVAETLPKSKYQDTTKDIRNSEVLGKDAKEGEEPGDQN